MKRLLCKTSSFLSYVQTFIIVCIICICPLLAIAEYTDTTTTLFQDTLVYPTSEEALQIWTPAMGTQCNPILEPTDKGISLNNIEGDCYEEANSQNAIFLKKPPRPDRYSVSVVIDEFQPAAKYAQSGLVA